MRNSVVIAKLYDLRVDQDQLDFIRICLVDKAGNNTVDADRFARTGRACDQKMRHGLQIRHNRITADILADREGDLGLALFECVRVNDFTQSDHRNGIVLHFDADRCFARDRRFDTNGLCFQIQRNIIRKPHDAADLHADRGLNLIARDRRSLRHLYHSGVNMEVLECFLQLLRLGSQQMGIRLAVAARFFQERDRWLLVFLRCLLCVDLFSRQHGSLRLFVGKLLCRYFIRCSCRFADKGSFRLLCRLADLCNSFPDMTGIKCSLRCNLRGCFCRSCRLRDTRHAIGLHSSPHVIVHTAVDAITGSSLALLLQPDTVLVLFLKQRIIAHVAQHTVLRQLRGAVRFLTR